MLQEMGRSIQAMKDPKGTKEAPARTCKDLAARHPDYESGIVFFSPLFHCCLVVDACGCYMLHRPSLSKVLLIV